MLNVAKRLIPALLAALVVGVGEIVGWRGVDTAAQIYRVDSFRQTGFQLWDFQWYGGHWTLDYSVLYPAAAAVVGVAALAVASAALAALAFDRLVVGHFGPSARVASMVFAVGMLVPTVIGQLPFLSGAALGLAGCWALSRGRWRLAAVVAVSSSLCSPLAGAFVAMAVSAWVLSRLPAGVGPGAVGRPALVAVAAVAPVLATSVLFPGQGAMPYPGRDYAWEVAVAFGIWVAAGRNQPVIRAGAVVFAVVATVVEIVPTPVGGNVGRVEDIVALPLAVALLWPRRWLLAPIAAIPLALSQWGPAWGVITDPTPASASRSFFAPLDAALVRLSRQGPAGRIEVVPTAFHWEAAYVAPVMPLARGWERQLDVADDPIFYRSGALTPNSYRTWLLDNGVRFVALSDAPLDMAAKAEAVLVASRGVPGLDLVWSSADWKLFAVAGSSGIVAGPARLVGVVGDGMVVAAHSAGHILIRERFSPDWSLSAGAGCVEESVDPWITVEVPKAEQFSLELSPFSSHKDSCPQSS